MKISDSFRGEDLIILQPNDSQVPYNFLWTVCSATTKNDGALPYGETISSISASAHTEAGVSATTSLIAASSDTGFVSLTSNTETVYLSYPTALGVGRYHLTFVVALSNTSQTMEFDFNRVVAKNI